MPDPNPILLDDGINDVHPSNDSHSYARNTLVVGPPGSARPVCTRPGIRAWSRFEFNLTGYEVYTGPVEAITRIGTSILYVVDSSLGHLPWELTNSGTLILRYNNGDGIVQGSLPIQLSSGRDAAIASAGGPPQLIAPGMSRILGGSPPAALATVFFAQRLVLVRNGGGGLFFWSDLGDGGIGTWDQTFEFREAEARPDDLVTCASTGGELYMLGTKSAQVFLSDPEETFAPGAVLDIGILARRSLIVDEDTAWWFDNNKRFIMSDMRGYVDISKFGIATTTAAMTSFEDIWGFRCNIGPFDLRVWVCPTDGRTFAWDKISQRWSEFRRWADSRWQPWAPTAYFWDEATNTHIVGMPDGQLRELSLDAYSDMDDPLKWEIITGMQGGAGIQHCIQAEFPMQRGSASSADSGVSVAWRDNLGPYVPPIQISLGVPGDYETVGIVSPAGEPYRRRSWRVSGSAAEAHYLSPGKAMFEEVDF